MLLPAKNKHSLRRNLPRPEEFSKALYVLDIGQNDVSAGIRSMTKEQFIKEVPDIIKQFGIAVKVSKSSIYYKCLFIFFLFFNMNWKNVA